MPRIVFKREKHRRSLADGDCFSETQVEAILDTFEAATRQRMVRSLRWSRTHARLNTPPPGLRKEVEKQALLREKLMLAGFTGQQARVLVRVSWYSLGLGCYDPSELFSEEARQLPADRQIEDSKHLRAIGGDFTRVSSDEVRPRIRSDVEVTSSSGGVQTTHRAACERATAFHEQYPWAFAVLCVAVILVILLLIGA